MHLQGQAIRIQMHAIGVSEDFPILFAVKQQKNIMSFPLPILLGTYVLFLLM